MKIIQLNAWLGRLSGPLARFIAEEQPDIICLQEVFQNKYPDKHLVLSDQFGFYEELKQASGLKYDFFAPNWGFKLAGTVLDEGNAIISRFPISQEVAEHTHGEYYTLDENTAYRKNTRVYQTCQLELPDGNKLSLLNYQGYLDGPHDTGTEMTVQTMRKIYDAAEKLPSPKMLAGDFNAWPESPPIKLMNDLGLENLTVSHKLSRTLSEAHRAPESDRARAVCDYIFTTPEIKVKSFKASEKIVSDHLALILEFDI